MGPNGPKIKNCITGRAGPGGQKELRAGPKNIVILPSLTHTLLQYYAQYDVEKFL